ncbi:MAG: ATP-binding protein, partial [Velocimicrobium sp.]
MNNNVIRVEELEKIENESIYILDIRSKEEHAKGSMEGAINIPMEIVEKELDSIPKEKEIYVLCHTGEKSMDIVELLEENGYRAYNIEGGYRSFLRIQLGRIVKEQDSLTEKTKSIERSIIKKYRRTVWRGFTKAIHDYELIKDGDKIAVCISGGKDSMLMAKLLQELKLHGKDNFELVFLVMNPGYNEENWQIILDNAKLLGIPLTVFDTDIFNIVADIESSPCYLCARMRRGYLYSKAKELGCNKIALGHHFDDVIETILMGMMYSGKVETMMPKLHSKNFEGMELIRPLYLIKEQAIKSWRDYNKLNFIQCACRFTESCASCGGGKGSKRDEMKALVNQLRATSDVIEMNIFNSVKNINLHKVIGYRDDGMEYNFLDDYDQK